MAPTLHAHYTRDEAILALGGANASPAWFCDNDFAVLPEAIVCLFTVGVGGSDAHTRLISPEQVEWHPTRLDFDPDDNIPWLPTPVREVRSADRRTLLRPHHVFLRAASDEQYIYTGRAHLGSYGSSHSPRTPADVRAAFTLSAPLPRDAWITMGGYPAWLVEVDHTSYRLDSGDVAGFRALLDRMAGETFSHLRLTRYENDMLFLFTNPDRACLWHQQGWSPPCLRAEDADYDGNLRAAESFSCACGIELRFRPAHTLTRDAAFHAAAGFFATGTLPTDVPWVPAVISLC